jgi:hypothetical protein
LISEAANAFAIQLDFLQLLIDVASHGDEILRADSVINSNIDDQLKTEVQFLYHKHRSPRTKT